jgi:hypothetical protein
MSAMAAGSVNTTWKYGTGSRSASRAAIPLQRIQEVPQLENNLDC